MVIFPWQTVNVITRWYLPQVVVNPMLKHPGWIGRLVSGGFSGDDFSPEKVGMLQMCLDT
jgi:hypothetical protein